MLSKVFSVISCIALAAIVMPTAIADQRPTGSCGPGNWATINGVKWGCKQVSGKWAWVIVGKDPSYRPPSDSQQAGSTQTVAQQKPKPGKVKGPIAEQTLLRTLQQGEGNSAFMRPL